MPRPVRGPSPRGPRRSICAFLWVYYGYPASTYEGLDVEVIRNRCGAALARRDNVEVDLVAGIPDSGIAHAIGYAAEAGVPYRRPFVKYTPTWPRSFMPQNQAQRDLVARMKLIDHVVDRVRSDRSPQRARSFADDGRGHTQREHRREGEGRVDDREEEGARDHRAPHAPPAAHGTVEEPAKEPLLDVGGRHDRSRGWSVMPAERCEPSGRT